MNKKYEITEKFITLEDGRKLYQIKANRDFSSIKKGDLGGYIESEHNLSHSGICWIFDDAQVYDNAIVYNDAWVYDKAQVYDNASIYGDCEVHDNAHIYGNSKVYDNAEVYDNAHIYGNSEVYDDAQVYEDAKVYDNAEVYGYSEIYGDAMVYGSAHAYDNSEVYDNAKVYDGARIYNSTVIYDNARIYGNAYVCGSAQVFNKARVHGDTYVCGNSKILGSANVHGKTHIGSGAVIYGNANIHGNAVITAPIGTNADIISSSDYKIYRDIVDRIIVVLYIRSDNKIGAFFNPDSSPYYDIKCVTINSFYRLVDKTYFDDEIDIEEKNLLLNWVNRTVESFETYVNNERLTNIESLNEIYEDTVRLNDGKDTWDDDDDRWSAGDKDADIYIQKMSEIKSKITKMDAKINRLNDILGAIKYELSLINR